MDKRTAFVVLTPYESRRLIAKAVARLPAVQNALKNGWIIIATGRITGYVAEEFPGEPMVSSPDRSGRTCSSPSPAAPSPASSR